MQGGARPRHLRLPATLGYVVWVSLESTPSFIMGSLLGLIFGAAAFWLLFRLDYQKEFPQSFAAAAGAYAGSLVLCGTIMCLLNLVVNGSLQSAHHASELTKSPIGPTFAWNGDLPVKNSPHYDGSTDEAAVKSDASEECGGQAPTTAPTADPAALCRCRGGWEFSNKSGSPRTRRKAGNVLAGGGDLFPAGSCAAAEQVI